MVVRLLVILGVIRAIVDFNNIIAPMMKEGFRLALGYNNITKSQISLSKQGMIVTLEGGMSYGTAEKLKNVLDAAPNIRMVRFNNVGGSISEAFEIYELMRKRKLYAYSNQHCLSACVIAFLGGSNRFVQEGAKIGLHSASLGSVDERSVPGLNSEISRLFRKNNVPEWFIRKAINTSSNDMWYPSSKELIQSKIVHRIINSNSKLSRIMLRQDIDNAAIQINKTLPKKLDKITVLYSVTSSSNDIGFVYHYRIDGFAHNYNRKIFRTEMGKVLIKDVCGKNSLQWWLKNGVKSKYKYVDSVDTPIGSIVVSKSDCPKFDANLQTGSIR